MSVSVVVPTAGQSMAIYRSVESWVRSAQHTGPDAEVVIVVNRRRALPALAYSESLLVRVVHIEQTNVSMGRNAGIAAARHDTVIFGDDGAEVPRSWCADLAAALRDPRYPVVTGPVRVPVLGPVTAFLNYQRVFDAPPIDAVEALTVTGALGLRRDRLPAGLRYDEVNLPSVGEDAAFGLALRAAGIPIRWLADIGPAIHLLPERIEEITDRGRRYGGGAARVWCRQLGPVPSPRDVLTIYRALVSPDYHQYRRFNEIVNPVARGAFALYDYLFTVAWLLGYLNGAGAELGQSVVDWDLDGLRRAFADLAAVSTADSRLTVDGWASLEVDYTRLDHIPADPDALVAAARRAIVQHVRPVTHAFATEAPAGAPLPSRRRATNRLPGLGSAWQALWSPGAPVDADAVNRMARAAGFGFREACAAIERTPAVVPRR